MESLNEPTVSPIVAQQRRLNILIEVLPEIVKQGDGAISDWVDKVTVIKYEVAAINETRKENNEEIKSHRLTYDKEIIDEAIKNTDKLSAMKIGTALNSIEPKSKNGHFTGQNQKRDPLAPDGSSQGIA